MGNEFELNTMLNILAARKEKSELIGKMDDILRGEGEPSEFLVKFLNRMAADLGQTLASLQSEESQNGREKIKGYKENFFNEIIQNIEDLKPVDGESLEKEWEGTVEIKIQIPENEDPFEICCSYMDSGFSCSDLYGFCNEGRGAKDNSKIGKYGIGIKAIFSVAAQIDVDSNVKISATREKEEVKITRSSDWDGKHTRMKYVIPKCKSEEECWINIGKLKHIENVDGSAFLSDNPQELLFDCRALLFTSKIKCIKINDWEIRATRDSEGTDFSVWSLTVKNKDNVHEYRYLVYTPSSSKSNSKAKAFAFCLENEEQENRIYSVYFVKNYKMEFLKRTGILVNLDKKYTNSFRNEVGDTLEEINEVHKAILEELKEAFWKFSQEDILKEDEQIREALSVVYHNCLWAYREEFLRSDEEFLRSDEEFENFGVFKKVVKTGAGNTFLPKIKSDVVGNDRKIQKYVVREKDQEEYIRFDSLIEEEKDAKQKKAVYRKVFEAGEVVTYRNVMNEPLSDCVRDLYEFVGNPENRTEILCSLLNYHDSVRDFICFRVFGPEQERTKWQTFLKYADPQNVQVRSEDEKKIIRKLLGTYGVLEFLDRTGRLNKKLTVLDYLFLERRGDSDALENEIFKVYDDSYGALKEALIENIAELTVIEPRSCSKRGSGDRSTYKLTSKNENPLDEKLIFQLLDLIRDQDLYKYIRVLQDKDESLVSLISDKDITTSLVYRKKDYEYSEEVKKCKLFFFGESLKKGCDICHSLLYQPVLDKINKLNSCRFAFSIKEEKTDIKDLLRLATEIVKRKKEGLAKYFVTLKGIDIEGFANLCEDDYAEFVRLMTGGKIEEIILGQLEVSGKSNVTVLIRRDELLVKSNKGSQFETWCEGYRMVIPDEDKRVFVFYAGSQGKEEALSDAVKVMGLGDDVEEQIEGYISMSTIGRSVSGHEYERALRQYSGAGLELQLCDGKLLPKDRSLVSKMSIRVKKKLLLARGSYDGCCPICGKALMGEAKDDLSKAADVAKIFTVKLQPENEVVKLQSENEVGRFFQSCCCADCLELLRKTAIKTKLEDENLKFTMKLVSGEKATIVHEKVVRLSNVNQIIGFLGE